MQGSKKDFGTALVRCSLVVSAWGGCTYTYAVDIVSEHR